MAAQAVMGGLVVVLGLLALGVGVLLAQQNLRAAHRSHQKTAALSAATLESWDAWFLGGFCGVTMGLRWLSAVVSWLAWTLGGLSLIWLGIRLFGRLSM